MPSRNDVRSMSGVLPARPLRLLAADGVRLSGLHLPGPAGAPAVVIGHGFTNSTAAPSTRAVIAGFARQHAVYAVDFRGHGGSGGRSSVGRDEVLDLDAVLAAARADGHEYVAVVGFSMGGSVVLRHAAVGRQLPDAVVSVSAPSRWYIRQTPPMRRVHWLLEHPAGPLVGRMLGVRLGPTWDQVPSTPLEEIHRIAPLPLLLVHGTADHYFSPMHATMLRDASAGHAELWLEPGMGHAETATSPDLIERITTWLADHRPGHNRSGAQAPDLPGGAAGPGGRR